MFSQAFKLLQNEAFLTRGELSAGLTALRNAAHPDKAKFYSGFFSTAIALERLMKLIVVADHMLSSGYVVPTKDQLKAYGHNLVELYTTCVAIGQRNGIASVVMPAKGSIEREILGFLSDFAMRSRYYNLDTLGAPTADPTDPLARWERVLLAILDADAPQKKVLAIKAQSQALAQLLADSVHGIQHGMDGRQLSLQEVILQPSIHSLA